MHLENEMVARRQQAIDCHAGWQQGECAIKQGVASGYEWERPLNIITRFSLFIRVHRKCGRTELYVNALNFNNALAYRFS